MISQIKKILPVGLKVRLRQVVKFFKYRMRREAIKAPVSRDEPIKIIVGAAETFQDGWYSTNEQWLDITKADDWKNVFQGKALIQNVVAEHVFEHLTKDEALRALQHIHQHMLEGGRVRIAVPDGYHPDEDYLRHVGIGGIGDDAADHKQLLNVDVLSSLIAEAGFTPEFVEGYDRDRVLHSKSFSDEDGYINRSRIHADEDRVKQWHFVDADTSLIVDGIKNA